LAPGLGSNPVESFGKAFFGQELVLELAELLVKKVAGLVDKATVAS